MSVSRGKQKRRGSVLYIGCVFDAHELEEHDAPKHFAGVIGGSGVQHFDGGVFIDVRRYVERLHNVQAFELPWALLLQLLKAGKKDERRQRQAERRSSGTSGMGTSVLLTHTANERSHGT